jgi:tRNA A37 threonylcarbamoyltransferase TsaD
MRLRDLAMAWVGYGYRRLHVLIEREGWHVNHKRVYRLYREEGLAIRRRPPRRRKACKDRSLDFSFSGLKTAALKLIRENGIGPDSPALADFLASFEEIVARSLLDNVRQAVDEVRPRSLILCGEVARNTRLRTMSQGYAAEADLPAYVSSPKLCTDNAAMVGAAALRRFAHRPEAVLDLDLDAYPR